MGGIAGFGAIVGFRVYPRHGAIGVGSGFVLNEIFCRPAGKTTLPMRPRTFIKLTVSLYLSVQKKRRRAATIGS